MSKSIDLKILPLSINDLVNQHQEVFEEHGLNPLIEYLAYLLANTSTHHYNGMSLEEWYVYSIKEWSKHFGNVW